MRLVEKQLKHYRILEKLGEGSLGFVYKALDTKLDEVRALKVLRPSLVRDPAFVERFVPEAKHLARLNHPHIVTIHWFFEKPPLPFLVMDYVEGTSLAALFRDRGPLDYTEAVPLIKQVLQALAYAHGKGLTHRDLKPSNVLITADGQARVTDFGLAKQPDGTGLANGTATAGAPNYLSPEHVRRRSPVDHRSDLYAVGAILYEALTGRAPFAEQGAIYLVLRAIIEEPVVPPHEVVPEVPEALSAIVMKALARDPTARYQSADAMLDALEAFEARVSVPSRPKPEPEAQKQGGRRWGVVAAVALGLVLALALAWWVLRDVFAPPPPALLVEAVHVDSFSVTTGVQAQLLSSESGSGQDGTLVLRALPYGTIRLAGRVVGEDSVEVHVPAGRVRIECAHPAYGTRAADVEVEAEQRQAVTCYFEGYLRVQASDAEGQPLQANLYVDDLYTGRQTPVEDPYPLPPGTYTVEAFREGHVGTPAFVTVQSTSADTLLSGPPVISLSFVLQRVEADE